MRATRSSKPMKEWAWLGYNNLRNHYDSVMKHTYCTAACHWGENQTQVRRTSLAQILVIPVSSQSVYKGRMDSVLIINPLRAKRKIYQVATQLNLTKDEHPIYRHHTRDAQTSIDHIILRHRAAFANNKSTRHRYGYT